MYEVASLVVSGILAAKFLAKFLVSATCPLKLIENIGKWSDISL